MARYSVRPMVRTDAEEVSRIHLAVWRETYAGLMPAAFLSGLTQHDWMVRWKQALAADASKDVIHLVGVDEAGGIVGFGSAGPSRDEQAAADWELYAINLLAHTHGSGLADLLFQRLTGVRAASMWVLVGNDRAIAFYRRRGFEPDGVSRVHAPSGGMEQRMVRPEPADAAR